MRLKQLYQLLLVQFREFVREPEILFWSIGFPILMAWVLGVAFTAKKEVIQKVALIENLSDENNDLRNFLKGSVIKPTYLKEDLKNYSKTIPLNDFGKTTFVFIVCDLKEANILLKQGVVSVIMVENHDKLNYRIDPNSPGGQLIYLQLTDAMNNIVIREDKTRIEPLTETGTRYIDFLVPGLIALGIMNSCLWGICYSLIDMRSKKLLRRMLATPMSKVSFIASHYIARMLLGLIESFILIIFARIYFQIQIEGNILLYFLVFISGYLAFSGLALILSSRTANSQIGNGLITAVNMPMMVLSGIFFSYHNFPDWTIPIIRKLPLTMVADSIRSIFIEGAVLKDIGFE